MSIVLGILVLVICVPVLKALIDGFAEWFDRRFLVEKYPRYDWRKSEAARKGHRRARFR